MKLHIKNMVCNRCKLVVKAELEKSGYTVTRVELGEVEIEGMIDEAGVAAITKSLRQFGFDILNNKNGQLIEQVKTLITQLVTDSDLRRNKTLSDYLASALQKDYSFISKLFSESESITIEQFYILQKIEKAKEWLACEEMNLTQISYELNYSSVAHLSAQFKKITGLTPSHFKQLHNSGDKSLDKLRM
jgi:AraC family transcriptional regulator